MRVVWTSVRLFVALIVVAFVSWQLLSIGNLPIEPHALPSGSKRLVATAYSIVWWIAIAVAVSGSCSLVVASIVRIRGASGHRALRFISDAFGIITFGIAGVALSAFVFEFPLSTVLATSSILAVVLGFALQNTVADLLSGLALSIEQPFRIGDRIDLGDRAVGRVVEMNWRATHIITKSGDLVVVPNSVLSRNRIINHDPRTATPHRASVQVKLGTNEPPARVSEILKTAAMRAHGVLATPPPRIDISAISEWAVDYRVLFFFDDFDEQGKISSAVYHAIWSHLSWAGIADPTPRTLMSDAVAESVRSLPTMLKQIDVFAHLTDDERTGIAEQFRERHVGLGTHIIDQGGSDHSLFIVRDGIFEVVVKGGEPGTERTVAKLYPGDYVGEASLLTGAPRNATVKASTPGVVLEIDKTHFEPYLNARPDMAETLASVLVARMAARDAVPVSANGGTHTALSQVAGQILAFFRH